MAAIHFKSMANNTKVLDVKDNNTSNGASIIVYENTGGDNQKWNISSVGNGYYNVIPKIAADKNLDVNSGFTSQRYQNTAMDQKAPEIVRNLNLNCKK